MFVRERQENGGAVAMLVVGVDLGLETFKAVVEDSAGARLAAPTTYKNDLEGANEFRRRLGELRQRHGGPVWVGMEATGAYGRCLASWLQANEILTILVSPRRSHHIREGLGDESKTDRVDAHAVAEVVRTMLQNVGEDLLKLWATPEPWTLELRELTRLRTTMEYGIIGKMNLLHAALTTAFIEYYQLLGITRSVARNAVVTKASLRFLQRFPTPQEIRKVESEEAFRKELRKATSPKFAARVLPLWTKCQGKVYSEHLPVEGLALRVRTMAKEIVEDRERQKPVEGRVLELLAAAPMRLPEAPGMGGVLEATMLAEALGFRGIVSGRQLARLMGLTTRHKISITVKGRPVLSKRGRKELRTSFIRWAHVMKKVDGNSRTLFEEMRKRKGGGFAGRNKAIGYLAHKLATGLFASLRDKTPFETSRLMQK